MFDRRRQVYRLQNEEQEHTQCKSPSWLVQLDKAETSAQSSIEQKG